MAARHAHITSHRTHRVATHRRTALAVGLLAASSVAAATGLLVSAGTANAAAAPVGLGTAAAYSVLGGSTVTNTGTSVLAADLGVSPGTAITGFPPGIVGGTVHAADANAAQAQSDLTTAYNDAAGRAKTGDVSGDLVGQTLVAGVYKSTDTLAISGTVTLNAQGDPSSVFIFQVASTLITATSSKVALINGAQACHVYWQIGSSATLGTTSIMVGSVMALTSVTVTTGTVVQGRALARNGAVTLDNNVFQQPGCNITTPTTTAATTTTSTTSTGTSTGSTTGTSTGTNTSSGGTGSTSTSAGSSGQGGGTSSALSGSSSTAHGTATNANGSARSSSTAAALQAATQTSLGGTLASTGTSLPGPLIGAALCLFIGAVLVAVFKRPSVNRRGH
jgi:hypothetical protein